MTKGKFEIQTGFNSSKLYLIRGKNRILFLLLQIGSSTTYREVPSLTSAMTVSSLIKKNINNRIRRINYANSQRIRDIHQEFKDKIIKSRIILPFYIFISLILHNPYPMYYFKLALKI